MSGFGGFSGFGQQNNNQQQQQTTTGFGGFGQSNTTSGFGAPANTSGFGATSNTGSGLFGGNSPGFGSNSGGFGNTQNSGFGAKPAFGSPATTSSTSLFGSTATAGNTGFGFGANTANTTPAFGANTSSGLFGSANKPAFGAANTTTSPFGASTTNTGFGTSGSGFGAPGGALGGAVTECQGTGAVPFQATVEKEQNSATNAQNSFQSISFQQPYVKFSPEELRLADYAQGRKNGNASGQPGAFGTTSGFGGFNNNTQTNAFGSGTNTGTGLFGGSSQTSSPFGQNNSTNTGFGSNTSTGLFGQQKPATSLFGGTNTQTPATGNLFGSNSTGFGNTSTTSTGFGSTPNTGTSLFGGNNANTTQNKSPFSFGSQNTTTPATGFGTANTGTGFGASSAGTGLFGGNAATQQNTSNPFGAATTQQSTANPFSGFGNNQQQQSTTSLFGGNQQKPATSLFGGTTNNTTTGTNLFGGNAANNTTTPFGGTTNNQTTSLFGQKPATTGTGLFGGNTATNTGTSLFGGLGNNQNNQNQQQNTGTSLFGGLNNAAQKPSLFGTQNTTTGTGLFGSNNQTSSTSLFGGLNNSQNQQNTQTNPLGSSLFNTSQQNQQSQPASLTASLNDPTAFGTSSMFSNLATPEIHNPGPLATPLSSLSKGKKATPLPLYKLNPASASRFVTPQKRGYGFSYSTYGTPGSASSTSSTPLTFGNSLLGNGLGRLSKSVSTSSLRGSYNSADSILAPGAFSASPSARYNSVGSMKKLVINRSIKGDLFSPPAKELVQSPSKDPNGVIKKRVSFESSTTGGTSNGTVNGFSSPLKQVQSTEASPSVNGVVSNGANGNKGANVANGTNNAVSQPEMEQVKGKELAIVPEEEASTQTAPEKLTKPVSQVDQEPGAYWMRPSKEEILDMNRVQRQKVSGFTVGRDGVGEVHFEVPVDLTNIDLDTIYGNIVELEIRSATVYPIASKKPPMGKGLNVPATIRLQNSWPRGRDKRHPSHERGGPRFAKHIERLSRVADTKFLDYNKDTGVWTFSVEHFTTYGFDYDDDETEREDESHLNQSTMTAPPDTPTPRTRTPKAFQPEDSFASSAGANGTSDPDDTFDFKKKKLLPGAFDDEEIYEDDAEMEETHEPEQQSFLDERSVGSHSDEDVDEPMDQSDVSQSQELVRIEDQEMAGSFPQPDDTAERNGEYSQEIVLKKDDVVAVSGGIQRAKLRALRSSNSNLKNSVQVDDDDWGRMLQQTISPVKQNRGQLKLLQKEAEEATTEAAQQVEPAPRGRVASDGRGFATSIDLMHSLFGENKSPTKAPKTGKKARGFQTLYANHPKTNDFDESNMDANERAFHDSLKPSWGPNGVLVYASSSSPNPFSRTSRTALEKDGILVVKKGGVISEARDIRFATFSSESSVDAIKSQKAMTTVGWKDGIPAAQISQPFKFSTFFSERSARDPGDVHEKLVWELASVLFDPINLTEDLRQVPNASKYLRKDNLSAFWEKLVEQDSAQLVAMAKSSEEKAIASLSGHKIPDACAHLLEGKDFHLATLVSLLGGNETMRKSIKEQLQEWQKQRVLSEINQPIRALYEILAGNVCVCDGTKGAPVEDRIETFIISKRFGLDWRQAFGLRLWYGILSSDDIGVAVEKFAEDLKQDKETATPQAWYAEQGISPLWKDEDLAKREDLLWGLLKLYSDDKADLEAIIRPENSQLSPLNARLSWQLSRALTASGNGTYGVDADEKADQLTLSFASQLTNEGNWLDATFVLLHLSSPSARAKSIQNHIAHHAGKIGMEDSQAFITLVNDLKIPTAWIWEAKALYMRSVQKNAKLEVGCLIRAGLFDEAHRTFSREVAPNTVIERDWETLRSLLSGFRGKEGGIAEWHLGGGLYSDYLTLVEEQKKGKIDPVIVDRLLAALPAMVDGKRNMSFVETVAAQEISGIVAKLVIESGKHGKHHDLAKVLRLPLTEDTFLKHTIHLSEGYYRAIMAGGK